MREFLDLPTVITFGLLITLIMGINVTLVVFRRGIDRLWIWILSNAALLALFVEIPLSPFLPGPLQVVLFNGFQMLTLLGFVETSELLLAGKSRRLPLATAGLFAVLAVLVLSLIQPYRWPRIALSSLVTSGIAAHAAASVVFQARRTNMRNGPVILAATFGTAALFYLARSVLYGAFGTDTPLGLGIASADSLVLLVNVGLFTAVDFALLVVLMVRVEREVNGKVLELGESRNNLQILNDTFAETAGTVDLEELIPRILDLLHDKLHIDAAVLYLRDRQNEGLTLVAQRGLSSEAIGELMSPLEAAAMVPQALAEGRPVIGAVADYPEASLRTELASLGLSVIAAFPLHARGEAFGVLVAAFRDKAALDDTKTTLLETMTSQLGAVVRAATLHAELERANARLDILASTDALTHLPNRRTALRVLEREIARAKRLQSKIAVIMADIDHFKDFNDRFGHDCGDFVLEQTSSLIAESLRSTDLVARWGGEEFLVILGSADPEGVVGLAERIRRRVESTRLEYGGRRHEVTITLGIAICPPEQGGDHAIAKADEALYEGKRQGRNCVGFHPGGDLPPIVNRPVVEVDPGTDEQPLELIPDDE